MEAGLAAFWRSYYAQPPHPPIVLRIHSAPIGPPVAIMRGGGGGARDDYVRALRSDPCAYCGHCPGGTVDHIVAQVAGGGDDVLNLTGACGSCNVAKRGLTLLDFLLETGCAPRL